MELVMKIFSKRLNILKITPWHFESILVICLLMILATLDNAFAKESVCAEVKIVIEQKLSLERQAFDAKMVIRNGLHDSEIKDVNIDLLFLDKNEQVVVGTTDPNAVGAKFFYRTNSLSGIDSINGTGHVAADSAAEVHWLIIPAAGSAQNEGSLYFVGAKVTYTLNDLTTTVDVTPDFIVVKPQPKLILDYFLPKDVYADDPFTAEEEPPVPFTLGVRIKNTGSGAALKTSIESAQPKIVENKLNLLIDFKILGGYVSDQPAGQSLLLDFGTIEGKSAKVGRWNMITTLSGQFVEFNANYSHADELGGAVTSLLEEVNTHTLVHDVKVDLPGRDNIRDFLALDTNVLRVYESDGFDTVVTDSSTTSKISLSDEKVEINGAVASGFSYIKVTDPYHGNKIPTQAVRSDGKVLHSENIWLSKTHNEDSTWSYFINLFDVDSTGNYKLSFSESNLASLSGFVFDDVNGNGILEDGESGIGVAKITLSGLSETGSSLFMNTYTDIKGQFSFSKIVPGQYALAIAPIDGMTDSVSIAGNAGGIVNLGKITDIDLNAGVVAQNYYFGKQQGSPVLPEVNADLAIDIVASSITPNAGEQITLVYTAHNAGPDQIKQSHAVISWPATLTDINCQSDSDSQYLDGLWNIGLLYPQTSKKLTCQATVTDFTEDMVIEAVLSSQIPDPNLDNNEYSVTLTPRTGQAGISGMVYADTNRNGVQDTNEVGIASIAVTLSGKDDSGTSVWYTTFTDSSGQYHFNNLIKGVYTLEVAARGWMLDGMATAGDTGGIATKGKISNIYLSLGKQSKGYDFAKIDDEIHGTVATLYASAYFYNGTSPIAGSDVEIYFSVDNIAMNPAYAVSASIQWPTGFKDIHCLDNDQNVWAGQWNIGDMKLSIKPHAELRCTAKVVSVNPGDFILYDVTTRAANLGYGLTRLFLDVANPLNPENGNIRGMIYNDINGSRAFDGIDLGIENIGVTLQGKDQNGQNILKNVNTDMNGVFIFDEVKKGNYSIKVAEVPGMIDSAVSTSYPFGNVSPGYIENIAFNPQARSGQYFFAKRKNSDTQANLVLNGQSFSGKRLNFIHLNGKPAKDLDIFGSASYVLLYIKNQGPDIAKDVRVALEWDESIANISCHPLAFTERTSTLILIGGIPIGFLKDKIENKEWLLMEMPVVTKEFLEISDLEKYVALCGVHFKSTAKPLVFSVKASSQTTENDPSDNTYSVQLSYEKKPSETSGLIYTDINGNSVQDN